MRDIALVLAVLATGSLALCMCSSLRRTDDEYVRAGARVATCAVVVLRTARREKARLQSIVGGQPETLQLALQCASIDAERGGGARDVAFHLREHTLDVRALDLGQAGRRPGVGGRGRL